MPKAKRDLFLIGIVITSMAFVGFWVLYGNFLYTHYISQYYDLGPVTYSMYWHLHPGNGAGMLQYLVFGNHISPFGLLLLPLFALYQHPISTLIMQDLAIALTAIIIYLVCRDLIKSSQVGFAMAAAFLVNPGTVGILMFDFHIEAFLPIFCIMAFYFYMKEKGGYFVLSYVLLLSVIEEAPFVGITLLIGLLIYELWYRRLGSREVLNRGRLRMLFIAFIMTILFTLMYYSVSNALTAAYPGIPYTALSPLLWYNNTLFSITHFVSYQFQLGQLSSPGLLNLELSLLILTILFCSFILVLGFGLSPLANPLISIVLYSPWIILVLVLHGVTAISFYHQYYSYALGGAVVSAILGFLIISDKERGSSLLRKNYSPKKNQAFILPQILSYSILISLLLAIWPSLFPILHNPNANMAQLDQVVSTIPSNASVMAQANIAPHLSYLRNLELLTSNYSGSITSESNIGGNPYWFVPEYIILDENTTYACLSCNGPPNPSNSLMRSLLNYTSKNYTEIYNQSGIILFKRK